MNKDFIKDSFSNNSDTPSRYVFLVLIVIILVSIITLVSIAFIAGFIDFSAHFSFKLKEFEEFNKSKDIIETTKELIKVFIPGLIAIYIGVLIIILQTGIRRIEKGGKEMKLMKKIHGKWKAIGADEEEKKDDIDRHNPRNYIINKIKEVLTFLGISIFLCFIIFLSQWVILNIILLVAIIVSSTIFILVFNYNYIRNLIISD